MLHIDYGLGALRAEAVKSYAAEGPLDLTKVYQDLLVRDELLAREVGKRFYEIGSPAGLEQFRQRLRERERA